LEHFGVLQVLGIRILGVENRRKQEKKSEDARGGHAP
jgi:hypothetical protein